MVVGSLTDCTLVTQPSLPQSLTVAVLSGSGRLFVSHDWLSSEEITRAFLLKMAYSLPLKVGLQVGKPDPHATLCL